MDSENKYIEALDWLYAQLPMFSREGAAAYKPGLDRVVKLAGIYGHPERKFKSVHIAGTNGKGSVSNIISAVLQSQGYKTGLYTSPHLTDFRERMRINGEMIPRERVAGFVDEWKAGGNTGVQPSFFELTMMMAFKWFADEQVDIAVIETGMGGRLDSTNIIIPELSVITNISWDHTQFLGSTLSQIAAEKAGIIKPGVPVVVGEAEGEVTEVFRRKAKAVNSPLREAYMETDAEANGQLNCSLRGDYQKKNVNTARVSLLALRETGWEISDEAMRRGFGNVESLTGFTGRWTICGTDPLVICDTGHNEAGLRYNINQLKELMGKRHNAVLRIVMGFVADKDISNILALFPKDAVYYLTNADIPRALPAGKLGSQCRALGLCCKVFPSVKAAAEIAKAQANADDIIYIGGSTFIVADYLGNPD